MFCVECGKEIPNGVKFCPECGASQIVKVEEKPARAKPNKKISTKKETTDYSKMVKADLKKILKSKKLPISGSKKELIERLTDKNWKKKNESKKLKNNKSGKKKNTKAWENFQILMWSMPGIMFLFFNIGIWLHLESTPPEPVGTFDAGTVPSEEACSDYSFGCMEIALYGLCGAITNIFLAYAFVKKPEASQNVFLSVFVLIILIVIGGLVIESGVLLQLKSFGSLILLLVSLILLYSASLLENQGSSQSKESKLLLAGVATVVIIIFIIGFLAFSSDDSNSDSSSSSFPPRGGDVELELRHRDAGYSELSYVVYFDDKEGPSGTLAYGENIWHTLCGNCEGSHTIEVYWGDGDDCQADIEVVGSSDEIWQCTNW